MRRKNHFEVFLTSIQLPRLLVYLGMAESNSAAVRLIDHGAVRVQLEPDEPAYPWEVLTERSDYRAPRRNAFYLPLNSAFILRVGRSLKRVTLEGSTPSVVVEPGQFDGNGTQGQF